MQDAQFSLSQQDIKLMAEVVKGKYELLDEFYRTNRTSFIRWAHNTYSLNALEAEDIYQDAIEALFQKIVLGKLENLKASLKSYLFSIGKYMIYRKIKGKNTYNLETEKLESEMFNSGQMQFIQIETDQQEHQLELVANCKKKLSGACHSILDLYYSEKKSMKEIALLLGYKNEDVVKSQKARCLAELRKCVLAGMDQ
jgi:RNA polymerase sigma factor (sigma-70 family)